MIVDFFCPRWGSEHIPWDTFLPMVVQAGYRGIEWFPYGEECNIDEVTALLQKHGLQFTIVMTVLGEQADFAGYLQELKLRLVDLSQIGKNLGGPLCISAQTGREYFSPDQIDAILTCCLGVSRDTGIPIYQETHRNKWSYALHVMPEVLKRHPETMLTLDISHWFCVSESLLEDQQEAMKVAIGRARHLHARIGHTQGSQVADPSLPQYTDTVNAHLRVWDQWTAERKLAGIERLTITPEFGPTPYLVPTHTTKTAWEQQWDLNLWMKDLLNRRYNLFKHS
ncbi:sugar phosphate isomerase/epimerase family protein [Pedobacter duraquae]|uniref:Sugar phosphate isomerase/epimerase n=1 Tax=Pedobacter duraquae TaxID=425511 RepID=A0A4R6IF98_9SPHI|nr:sugar phosphate isomerase/epimerase [Pedobacter duraquae]TDO19585.1 hypothetical protein CLV32_4207 [Pedobacter duraquae]